MSKRAIFQPGYPAQAAYSCDSSVTDPVEQTDFRLVWKGEPERKWPPLGEVADALLYVGAQQTLVYPDPSIYLEPAYQKELRRRAAIIKEYSGQDFAAAIDALVDEARRVRSR